MSASKVNIDAAKIALFLRKEVATTVHPAIPAQIHTFRYVDQLTDLFLAVLSLEVKETDLDRLESKILTALSTFMEGNDPDALAQSLETLATAFESFLKKIAAIKYSQDHVRLHGDGTHYAGLMKSSLGLLLEGKVAKLEPRNNSVPVLLAPIITFCFNGPRIQDAVYNRTRSLRNDIHASPGRTFFEVLADFRCVIAAYFFALEENIAILRIAADPLFRYLQRVKESFKTWELKYIELLGQVRNDSPTNWTELQALEWRDESEENLDQNVSIEAILDSLSSPSRSGPVKSLNVADIADAQPRFWLLGEPGAGKSTTLQRLVFQRATELLSTGYLEKPIPIFIRLRDISSKIALESVVASAIGVTVTCIESLLDEGKLWLLFDGLNEVPEEDFAAIAKMLFHFLKAHECPVIISSRRFGFQRRIGIPVFELLPLPDELILEYLVRHLPSSADARSKYDQLRASPRFLFELARNPMMLSMLTRVAQSGKAPDNRGQLFRLFMKWIFTRERKTQQMPALLKEAILSGIAMKIRQSGKPYLEKGFALDWIREILTQRRAPIGIDQTFSEILDNHILEIDATDRITFWHELILEYFTAVELEKLYLACPDDVGPLWQKPEWYETIRMLAGLLPDATDFIANNAHRNIVLAAQCIASGATVDSTIQTKVLRLAAERTGLRISQAVEGVTALLELGTDESLSHVVKQLAKENDRFPLTAAIVNCERPEQATVHLLRRGLTGNHRIFQCLSALQGGFVSRRIIDGPEITAAQRSLLKNPTVNDLRLLGELGLSSSVRGEMISACTNIVANVPIEDPRWRVAIAVAVKQGFDKEIGSAVAIRITNFDPGSAEAYFGVFMALHSIKELPNSRALAVEHVKRSLDHELFGLATRFIKLLQLRDLVPSTEIDPYLPILAKSGRLQALLEIHELYPAIPIGTAIQDAIGIRLKQGNLDLIRSLKDKLGQELIEPFKGEMARVLLSQIGDGLAGKIAVSQAKALGIAPLLSDLGIVKRAATAIHYYGFIRSLGEHGDVFYRPPAVQGVSRLGLEEGMLVRMTIKPSIKKIGKFVATSVRPVQANNA